MHKPSFRFRSKIEIFAGHAGWHFVTVGKKQSKIIREFFAQPNRGWGSVPVTVTLGDTSWNTSIFYGSQDKQYVMGLKAEVRKKENVNKGDIVTLLIEIREV